MDLGLSGKVALITGAGQGIGRGIALSLAAEGVRVAALGRTLAKCEDTCAEISRRFSNDAIALRCDVAVSEDIDAAIGSTVAHFGRIDILVNNAVSTSLGPLLSQTDAKVRQAFDTGPIATLRFMQRCYPYLRERGGSIVNMASTAAKRWDMSNYGVYAAEKEAIRALSRAAACEWGQENIRANCILPHANSPALEGWIKARPEEAAAFFATIPMRRIGDCEQDIGAFVALLCSEQCVYVNGQSIALDGGQANLG